MDRDVLWGHILYATKGTLKAFHGIKGKPGYKIHIDIKKSVRQLIRPVKIINGVAAPYRFQDRWLKRLRVYAYSGHAVFLKRFEFFVGDGVRTSRLDGVFNKAGQIEGVSQLSQYQLKLIRRQDSRRPAAYIQGGYFYFLFFFELRFTAYIGA